METRYARSQSALKASDARVGFLGQQLADASSMLEDERIAAATARKVGGRYECHNKLSTAALAVLLEHRGSQLKLCRCDMFGRLFMYGTFVLRGTQVLVSSADARRHTRTCSGSTPRLPATWPASSNAARAPSTAKRRCRCAVRAFIRRCLPILF